MSVFPWGFGQQKAPPQTPREILLKRLAEGVPPELACRAAGVPLESLQGDAEADQALAEGEILLFERARDSGVTGTIRAALRHETKSWTPKAEAAIGFTLEDLLKD